MINKRYKDYEAYPRKGGRSYTYFGQKIPEQWTIENTKTGKTYKNKEELDKFIDKPKRQTKKKVAA